MPMWAFFYQWRGGEWARFILSQDFHILTNLPFLRLMQRRGRFYGDNGGVLVAVVAS